MKRNKWKLIILLPLLLMGCQNRSVLNKSYEAQDRKQESAKLNVQLGMAYLERGNMVAAKSKFTKALRQASNLPLVHYAWGFYNQRTGEIQEADKAFRHAINLDPTQGEGHNNYGTFLCHQARYDEAERQFLLAVRDDTYLSTAESYENAGLCSLEAKSKAKAKKYFQQALGHDPRSAKSLLELAYLYFDEKNVQQASHFLSRYRRQELDNARTLYLGIEIAKAQGQNSQVVSQTKLLKNSFPNSKEARKIQGLAKK